MPSLAEISALWPVAQRDAFHELLDRLARGGPAPVPGEGAFECACRIEALRIEHRLVVGLWEALRDKWLSLPHSGNWPEFINALCIAWHGDPPKKPDVSPLNFMGHSVHPRPALVGNAFHPRGAERRSQEEEETPLSSPNPRSSSDDVAVLTAEHVHRTALSKAMLWVTWNPIDGATCPFANRSCGREVDSVLGLSASPLKQRAYVRYRLPAQIPLRIPLLTDAVVAGARGPNWHPYFLPAAPDAPYGYTRAVPPFENLDGCPEAIHRSLKDVVDAAELQIEQIALSLR